MSSDTLIIVDMLSSIYVKVEHLEWKRYMYVHVHTVAVLYIHFTWPKISNKVVDLNKCCKQFILNCTAAIL